MTRMSLLNSPLLLGFDEIERVLDRVTKTSGDGYPPYNIERLGVAEGPEQDARGVDGAASCRRHVSDMTRDENDTKGEILRITLAVAGFTREQLDVSVDDKQLTIRGRQEEDKTRTYLHRGIAARQFQRTFVLAEGIEVKRAVLDNGLLSIDLERPEPTRLVRKVEIVSATGISHHKPKA